MSIAEYISDKFSSIKAYMLITLDEANDMLQFTRIKGRGDKVKVLCSGPPPPDSILRKVFYIPEEEKLSDERIRTLREEYRKNCDKLVNLYYDRKFSDKFKDIFGEKHFFKLRWAGTSSIVKMNAEIFVNLALKAYELGIMSWSEWFITTSEGQMLLELINSSDPPTRIYALATLWSYILAIFIRHSSDELLFTKEFLDLFPYLSNIFSDDFVGQIKALIAAKAAGAAIMAATKLYLKRQYNIPEELFGKWLIE